MIWNTQTGEGTTQLWESFHPIFLIQSLSATSTATQQWWRIFNTVSLYVVMFNLRMYTFWLCDMNIPTNFVLLFLTFAFSFLIILFSDYPCIQEFEKTYNFKLLYETVKKWNLYEDTHNHIVYSISWKVYNRFIIYL